MEQSQLSLLAAQTQCARSQAARVREVGKDATAIERIAGCLRLTYAALVQGLRPEKAGPEAFVLRIGRTGEHEVNLGDRPVPVSGPYVRALFKEAGLALRPGQVILLEAALVRDLLEEALARVAHDQAMAERERSALEAVFGRCGKSESEFPEKVFEDAVKRAFDDASEKREEVRHRKVALLAADFALDELDEQKGRSQRAA